MCLSLNLLQLLKNQPLYFNIGGKKKKHYAGQGSIDKIFHDSRLQMRTFWKVLLQLSSKLVKVLSCFKKHVLCAAVKTP